MIKSYHDDQEVEKRAETPAPVSATPQSTRKDETVVDVQVILIKMTMTMTMTMIRYDFEGNQNSR